MDDPRSLVLTEEYLEKDVGEIDDLDKNELLETVSKSTVAKFKRTLTEIRRSSVFGSGHRTKSDPLEMFNEHDDPI